MRPWVREGRMPTAQFPHVPPMMTPTFTTTKATKELSGERVISLLLLFLIITDKEIPILHAHHKHSISIPQSKVQKWKV